MEYVQYMPDDTKGLKHRLHFYQTLRSTPFLSFTVAAGLDSVVTAQPYKEQHLYGNEKSIYCYLIKRVLVSFVYNFV